MTTTFPTLTEDHQLFKVPDHWHWCWLGELGDWGAGATPSRKDSSLYGGEIVWLKSGELNGNIVLDSEEKVTEAALKKASLRKNQIGDVLIAMYGATIGKTAIAGVECTTNQAVCACTPFDGLHNMYLLKYLQALKPYFVNEGKGGAQPNISRMKLINTAFALPPYEEQLKIVEKVDELMALCDQLEKQQQKKRTLLNQLRKATLDAVATATSPFELKQHWQRLEANFRSLFSQPEDVDDFISCVKQLAIEGLLTPPSSGKPDIDIIRSSKLQVLNQYLEKKLIRKQKTVSVAETEIEYPDNWKVLAFDEIALVIGGVTKGRNLRDRQMINCPYLAVANVQRGYFELANLKRIDIAKDEIDKYKVFNGDLLITEGGDWDKVGRTAIWDQEIDNCLHQNHVFKARVPSNLVLNEWIELIFNSSIGRNYFAGASKQTTNLASINMTQLRSFPVPIPPKDEQVRILNVVSALTSLSEGWRKKIKQVCKLQELFTKSIVSELTGKKVEAKEEPLKLPITVLDARIISGINPEKSSIAPLSLLVSRANGEIQAKDLWQRSGMEIDTFYAQLKTEVAHGWLAEPNEAVMNVLEESDNNE